MQVNLLNIHSMIQMMSEKMKLSDLIIVKSKLGPFRAWLSSWATRYPPTSYPLLVTGSTGTGKTTVTNLICQAEGFHPQFLEEEKIDELFHHVMLPTMEGKKRVAIIDNADEISKKNWRKINKKISEKLFPMIIIVENKNSVSWQIKSSALVIDINNPNQVELEKFLTMKNSELNLNRTRNDIIQISRNSNSWRNALLKLITTPTNWHEKTNNVPLSGLEREKTFRPAKLDIQLSKPTGALSALEFSEYNNAKVQDVETGMYLLSKSWKVAGLSKISRAYISEIETNSNDKVPFRKSRYRKR